MALNQSQHRHVDMNLSAAHAIGPADASTVYTAGIDTRGGSLKQPVTPSQTVDQLGNAARDMMEVMVVVDATTTLVDGKNLTIGLQSSDDDAVSDAYAAIAGLTTQVVTGVTGNGSARTELRWKLPSFCERYIRASCSCPADGGTNTAKNFTLYLLT